MRVKLLFLLKKLYNFLKYAKSILYKFRIDESEL